MKLIVGLGNPGRQYEQTRHNAGFMVVERLGATHAPAEPVRARFNSLAVETVIDGEKCLLLRPTVYMNRSGQAVAEAVGFFKLEASRDLIVVTDDLNLEVGAIRIRHAGSDGGHNGLADIQRTIGTDAYPRLRVGIGARPAFMNQADYVLSRFSDDEMPVVTQTVAQAAEACRVFVSRGVDAAMNQFNVKSPNVRPGPAAPDTKRQDGETRAKGGTATP